MLDRRVFAEGTVAGEAARTRRPPHRAPFQTGWEVAGRRYRVTGTAATDHPARWRLLVPARTLTNARLRPSTPDRESRRRPGLRSGTILKVRLTMQRPRNSSGLRPPDGASRAEADSSARGSSQLFTQSAKAGPLLNKCLYFKLPRLFPPMPAHSG